jgi:hypothetical protein
MTDPIPLAELELRILLLPPISRAAHLRGPTIHARRLVQLWRGGEMTLSEIGEESNDELIDRYTVLGNDGAEARAIVAEVRARTAKPIIKEVGAREDDLERAWARLRGIKSSPGEDVMTIDAVKDCLREIELAAPKEPPPETSRPSDRADHWGDDDVPLSQAFRLLDAKAVARAILRTALMSDNDYPNDSVHWPLPPLKDLLPELNDAAWQAVLDGELPIEATRYERGKIGLGSRPVPLVELPRFSPDWKLSRLRRGDRDEWLDARVRRAPVELPKREPKPKKSDLKIAMEEVAATYPPSAHPPFEEIWRALGDLAGPGVTRAQAREALTKYAPQLRGQPRYRSTRKSPD